MTEAVPAHRAWIVTVEAGLQLLLLDEACVEVVVGLLVDFGLGDDSIAAPVAVPVLLCRALRRGDQLGQHASERVDLMAA